MGDFSAPMNVGGSMSGGGSTGFGPDLGTLDEPVTETIMRDLRMVGNKMMCVLNPRKANIETLKNWDLWGPLILCLMLATLLSWFAPYEQKSLVFASVFVIIWCGAAVVTVNALLLGGNISFFQSVCVLGYCIFPLNIASLVCLIGGHILWRTVRARARASPPAHARPPVAPAHRAAAAAAAADRRRRLLLLVDRRVARLHGRARAAEPQGARGVPALSVLHEHRLAHPHRRQALR